MLLTSFNKFIDRFVMAYSSKRDSSQCLKMKLFSLPLNCCWSNDALKANQVSNMVKECCFDGSINLGCNSVMRNFLNNDNEIIIGFCSILGIQLFILFSVAVIIGSIAFKRKINSKRTAQNEDKELIEYHAF